MSRAWSSVSGPKFRHRRIQRDSAVLIDDQAFAAAVSSVSVLAIPFVLDQLVDQLSVAAANAAGA